MMGDRGGAQASPKVVSLLDCCSGATLPWARLAPRSHLREPTVGLSLGGVYGGAGGSLFRLRTLWLVVYATKAGATRVGLAGTGWLA